MNSINKNKAPVVEPGQCSALLQAKQRIMITASHHKIKYQTLAVVTQCVGRLQNLEFSYAKFHTRSGWLCDLFASLNHLNCHQHFYTRREMTPPIVGYGYSCSHAILYSFYASNCCVIAAFHKVATGPQGIVIDTRHATIIRKISA